MNARVFLLVLVSAVFMSVWTADQNAMTKAIARQNGQKHPLVESTAAPPQIHLEAPVSLQNPSVITVAQEECITPAAEEAVDHEEITPVVAEESVSIETQTALVFVASIPILASVEDHVPIPRAPSDSVPTHSVPSGSVPVATNEHAVTTVPDGQANEHLEAHEVPAESDHNEPALDDAKLTEPAETSEDEHRSEHAETTADDDSHSPASVEKARATSASDEKHSVATAPLENHEQATEDEQKSDETVAPEKEAIVSVIPVAAFAACIPLPKNLASGTWQVMTQSGEFYRITIERSSSNTSHEEEVSEEKLEEDFCITTTPEGVRWCFIRSFVDKPAPSRRASTEFFSPMQR